MKVNLPAALVLIITLTGCTTMQFETTTAKEVDLSKYRSFEFEEIVDEDTDPVHFTPENQQRVQMAISTELEQLGYERTSDPELRISLYLKVNDEKRKIDYGQYYGGRHYYGGYSGYQVQAVRAQNLYFKAGTLIVDLVDVAEDTLVWQGIIQDEFFETEKLSDQEIKQAFGKLFTEFPPAS